MEYELFRSFYDEQQAQSIHELLQQNGIQGKLEKYRPLLDAVLTGHSMDAPYQLKLKGNDFLQANQVLDREIMKQLSELPPDYYLFNFTTPELKELLEKPDEWSNQDVLLAKKILNERGEPVNEKDFLAKKSERIHQLARSEKESLYTIILGYLAAFIISLPAIFFGAFIIEGKKLLPDGSRIRIYDKKTRRHGMAILIISITLLLLRIFRIIGW